MSVLSSNFGSCFHGHFFLWFTRFYSPFVIVLLPWLPSRCCDTRHNGTRHNDSQYNDTRHNGFNYSETKHIVTTRATFLLDIMLSAVMLSAKLPIVVVPPYFGIMTLRIIVLNVKCYAECHIFWHAECHYA
jgi:hypothetical protein